MSTEQASGEQPIRYVLFVCSHNAGRSLTAKPASAYAARRAT